MTGIAAGTVTVTASLDEQRAQAVLDVLDPGPYDVTVGGDWAAQHGGQGLTFFARVLDDEDGAVVACGSHLAEDAIWSVAGADLLLDGHVYHAEAFADVNGDGEANDVGHTYTSDPKRRRTRTRRSGCCTRARRRLGPALRATGPPRPSRPDRFVDVRRGALRDHREASMGSALAKQRLSEEEYLAREAASEVRHEWYDGEMFAMAGGSDRHALLCYNFAGELRARMRGGPCVAFITDHRHRVPAASSYTYPDLVIRCRPTPEAPPEVRVLVEVFSESTEAFDRGDKFDRYRKDPALQEYVLVSQRARRVEHFRRLAAGKWELTIYGPEDDVVLPALGVTVPMSEIYLAAERERSDDDADPYRLD